MSVVRYRRLIPLFFGVIVLISGCLGGGGAPTDGPTATSTDGPTATDSTIPSTGSPVTDTPRIWTFSNESRRWTIGNDSTLPSGVSPHWYEIINARSGNDTALQLSLTVRRNDSIVLQRDETIPAESYLRIDVYRVGNYTLDIDPAEGRSRTFDVSAAFDCNVRLFGIALRPDGRWSTRERSEMESC